MNNKVIFRTENIYDYVRSGITDIIYNEALVCYSFEIVVDNGIKLLLNSVFQAGYNDFMTIDDVWEINEEEMNDIINIYKNVEVKEAV